ncbi:MAG TPA: tetratricopeptide repeat protein [Thermoanaerobaculia bacterium]|jgi:tetratricopeptide (TPR) repeat protein|nr:tetratricopeptide repeat protein [Thermoanaerobaculia bacterium]
MIESTGEPHADFEDLNRRGYEAAETGRLEEALGIFDELLAWARQRGTSELVDLAFCNRAAVAVVLGRGETELLLLRRILLKGEDPINCRLAAYNLARHYELTKNYKKATFYARIACERAERLGRMDWVASSRNLIGNVLLAESFVDQAAEEFEKALQLMPPETSVWRARILDNLGYCRVLQHRYPEGYSLLYDSLAVLRRRAAERYLISTHLDLCFAHLETGHYRHARRHGTSALRLAESMKEKDAMKNALYLLGECANLSGDVLAACSFFSRLQEEFFPEVSYLPGFLLAVDVRKLVNLHA